MIETLIRWRFFTASVPSVQLGNRLHIVGIEKQRKNVVCFPVESIDKDVMQVMTSIGRRYQLEGGTTVANIGTLVYDIKHWLTYNSSVDDAVSMTMNAAIKQLRSEK